MVILKFKRGWDKSILIKLNPNINFLRINPLRKYTSRILRRLVSLLALPRYGVSPMPIPHRTRNTTVGIHRTQKMCSSFSRSLRIFPELILRIVRVSSHIFTFCPSLFNFETLLIDYLIPWFAYKPLYIG
jgi:hypothetical protein